jgi:serine/threonine protein kinase
VYGDNDNGVSRCVKTRDSLDRDRISAHAWRRSRSQSRNDRDIKPSNVLVSDYDAKPVPKVIDFGVAKAIDQRLTEKTMFTQLGVVVGTLEYMSPEQAEMGALDIDTRSEIYSLGVLLYELFYLGDTTLAIRQLQRARELRAETLGIDHLDTLATMRNLGYVYRESGRILDAVDLLERVLKLSKERSRSPMKGRRVAEADCASFQRQEVESVNNFRKRESRCTAPPPCYNRPWVRVVAREFDEVLLR